MKNNRLALLLTIGLLLIALFLIWNQRSAGTLSKDAEFAVYDTSSVTKIFIAGMDDREVLLERDGNGWKLNKEFKAQQRKVSDLLNTMMKLRVRTPVAKAAHDNVITRMAGIAVKVEVYQMVPRINLFNKIKLFPRETRSLVYYVGDTPKDNMGTFMLKEGAKTAYIMQITGFKGFLSTRYSPVADDWRDHAVFNTPLAEIRSVEVTFNEEPSKSYTVTRSDRHNYTLKRIQDQHLYENYDTLRLLNFLTAFSDIRFEALLNNLPQQRIDSILNSPFLHRINLLDENGKTYSITTFTKKKLEQNMVDNETLQPVDLDRMYALVNDGRDFVLIQYFVFDKVLRPVTYFEPGSPEL